MMNQALVAAFSIYNFPTEQPIDADASRRWGINHGKEYYIGFSDFLPD